MTLTPVGIDENGRLRPRRDSDTLVVGGGSLVLIQTQSLGADAASVTFSGLSGDTDGVYLLQGDIVGVSGDNVGLRFNADTTAANYFSQLLQASGTSPTAFADSGATRGYSWLGQIGVGAALIHAWVYAASGKRRLYDGGAMRTDADPPQVWWAKGWWTNTADEITTLSLICDSGADRLAAGSVFSLYRLAR